MLHRCPFRASKNSFKWAGDQRTVCVAQEKKTRNISNDSIFFQIFFAFFPLYHHTKFRNCLWFWICYYLCVLFSCINLIISSNKFSFFRCVHDSVFVLCVFFFEFNVRAAFYSVVVVKYRVSFVVRKLAKLIDLILFALVINVVRFEMECN